MKGATPTRLFGGIETGGTWCVCALGTGPTDLIAHETFATTEPDATLQRILDFFGQHPAPAAVGIGSFGPVDVHETSPTWGYVTTTPKPGWLHVPIAPVIRDHLGVPVAFDTDVAAAALGEQRWGAARDSLSCCYVTVGTGIGGAILINGAPWHGLVHPEIGHMRIPHDTDRDPFPGSCPSHGDCWEGLASGPALAARWGISAQDLSEGHPGWELEAAYIASGIVNIVTVASPHRVILGGGILEHPGLLDMIRERVRTLLAGYLDTPLLGRALDQYLVRPALGDQAGVLGAISMAQMAAHREALARPA